MDRTEMNKQFSKCKLMRHETNLINFFLIITCCSRWRRRRGWRVRACRAPGGAARGRGARRTTARTAPGTCTARAAPPPCPPSRAAPARRRSTARPPRAPPSRNGRTAPARSPRRRTTPPPRAPAPAATTTTATNTAIPTAATPRLRRALAIVCSR